MLVLSRKLNEQICIGDNITITIVKTSGKTVRVGIDAPKNVKVLRGELPPLKVEASVDETSTPVMATESRSETSNGTETSFGSSSEDDAVDHSRVHRFSSESDGTPGTIRMPASRCASSFQEPGHEPSPANAACLDVADSGSNRWTANSMRERVRRACQAKSVQ